jgi:hypothetical protein
VSVLARNVIETPFTVIVTAWNTVTVDAVSLFAANVVVLRAISAPLAFVTRSMVNT